VQGQLSNGEPGLFRLVSEHGQLTTLEIYYALAGDDAVPDERLVAAHAQEARALGRPDGAVLRAELDTTTPIEKKAYADCQALVIQAAKNVGNPNPTPKGGTTSSPGWVISGITSGGMAGALCNDAVSSGSSLLASFYRNRTANPQWVLITQSSVPAGSYRLLVGYPQSFQRQLKVAGSFLGSAHSYYLSTAY